MPVIPIETVLAQRPLGLVLDIDGTLSPIAPTPDTAQLYPGVTALLERAKKFAYVAIMTGRGIDDGAAMVNVDGLTYIGTHGLEWCEGLPSVHPVEIVPEALQYVEPGQLLLDLVEQHLPDLPGVIVQRKHVGGSLHYRLSTDPERTRNQLWSLLEEPAQRLQMRLTEGKRIVEVRAPLAVDKGVALRRYAERFQLQGVVFAGDDLTDLDAVLEIKRLRQDGLAGLSIVVEHYDTRPGLLEHADLIVQEVKGMAELLASMVEILSS